MKTKSLVVLFLLLLGIGIGIGSQDASAARLKKEEYGGRIRMYYDKEEIFEAKRLDASGTQTDGGYYKVVFSIPGTKQVCHLTGLTENNMKEVQEELIARYKDGGDFSITSLDFIDTEKKDTTPSGDSELCWAGAAANMLHYAGWGRMSGHECDDIFDLFSEYFYNEGGFIPNAFGWYFNGVSYGTENEMERFREREGAPVDPKAPNGGWYIPDYAFDSATETLTIGGLPGDSKEQCVTIMNRMEKWFEAGDAIGLSVMNEGGGHAIAEFGYVTDEKYPDTDLRHYTAMIVADSDNDKTIIDDRRELPNTYTLLRMKPTDGETTSQKTLNLVDYGFELFSFTVLKTPSQVFRETSSNATKNKLTTPDVVPTSILFSNARPDKTESQLVAAGEDIRVTILASNLSDKQVNLAFPVRLTVRDAAGQVVQTLDDEIRIQDYLRYGNETDLKKTIQPLEAGTYQVTVEVNPSKSVQEAFFTNNSYTTELVVAKRTMDVSGISLSAEIPDFGKEESVQAKLTYTGENTIRKNNWKAWCSVAYFNNEEETKYWDDFCSTEFGEGGGYGNYNTKKKNDANYEYHALMKEQAVYNHNPKVQFRLRVIKEGEPTAYVYSPIYDLSYRKITCWVDDTKLTRLKGGATGLNPGEEIVVRLKNESTAEGTDPVSGKFFARIMVDENTEINVVPEMEFSLKKGEQSDPIRITKWGKPLYGNQAIDAFLGWDGRDPGYYSALADLEIEEADSTEVTTEQDVVDAYDSLTSFREAVAVAEKTGGTITFRSDIRSQQIMIDRPIEIKGKVSVNGYYTMKKCPLFQAFLTGNPKTKMFVLSEGANLTLKGIGILSMQTRQEPYIENNGGTLTIRQSQFGESSFPEGDGAAIHSTGGKLKIERSRFCSLMANRGGVVFAEGTDTEILNTYFEGNSGGNGACVYATGAPCTIVTSTFLNNNLYGDNSSFGDNIVYGDDQMTIIGSAFGANQGYVEVGGKAKLYGCFLEKAAGTVTADKATVFDDARALFMTDDPSSVLDFTIHDYPAETDDYDVASMIRNIYMARKRKGPYIRRQSDGTIGISTDGKQYTSTDIKAKFAEKSYTVDMFGKARTFQYGCLSTYFSYDDQLILGTAPYKMSAKVKKGKPAETALGRVVAHGIRKATGVSVALIAGGDLKGTIKKGNVTGKKARKVCADPYQIIEIKKLTGDQLKLLLEDSIQRMLRAQKKKKNDRNVLQISGAVVSYKASAKKGKRITGIRINDKKIKASKKYKVAMLSTDKTVKAYSTWARAQTFTMRSSCQEVMGRVFEMSKAKFKKTINKNHYVAVK